MVGYLFKANTALAIVETNDAMVLVVIDFSVKEHSTSTGKFLGRLKELSMISEVTELGESTMVCSIQNLNESCMVETFA